VIVQEVSAWRTAMAMIKEGLRPPIVHAATGLCRNRLRYLYRTIHGQAAMQGRVSECAYNQLRTRHQIIEGMAFYRIYQRLGGDRIYQVLDAELIVKAYRAYKAVAAECIDITTAWYIARDLRERVLAPRLCPVCNREYLYDPRCDHLSRCPLCGE